MATFSSLAIAAVAFAPVAYAYGVTLNNGLIQNFHADLPVYRTGSAISIPQKLLQQTLNSVAPGAQLSGGSGVIAQNGSAAVAFVHPSTGATTFFAQYDTLVPSNSISTAASGALFANPALFPADDTAVTQVSGPTLMTTTHYNSSSNTGSTDPAPILSHVIGQRTVDIGHGITLGVRGIGSKAIFGYGADGSLKSLTYAWSSAKKDSSVAPAPVSVIHDAIVTQLQPLAVIAPYTVDTVQAGYYDSGIGHIQPVFYFTASRDHNKSLPAGVVESPAKVSGYVPAGAKAIDPLPDLTPPGDTTAPATPPPADKTPPTVREEKEGFVAKALGSFKRSLPTINVARYVVRNDNAGWTTSANSFWSSLNAWNGKYAKFVNWQYYFAYPYLFTTNKQTYINSAHVALTEVHGNWDLFTTYQNWGDYVYINQIPAPGYGPGAAGKLAYWIIHACEVIPAVVDYPAAPLTSYNVWWNVFDGLHAVLGYRTEMYINDGVTTNFANWIGQGVPVVSAWLSAVHTDPYWYGSSSPYAQNYYDGNRGIYEPFGRASTIYVCGRANDVVWNVANLGRATCLTETYYVN